MQGRTPLSPARRLHAGRLGQACAFELVPQPVTVGPSAIKPIKHGLPSNVDRKELRRIVAKWQVIFATDDSGSMYGPGGDPHGVRYAAALSIVDLMVRAGGGHAGVVHWGTSAPRELALAPVDVRKSHRQLKAALTIPPTLGGNDAGAALELAKALLPAAGGSQHQAVLVLTDGIEQVVPRIKAAVTALPEGSVHFLLIDHSRGCSRSLEADWRALPLGSFTRLEVADPSRMSWQVANVLCSSVGLQLPPLRAVRRIGRFPW